MAYYTIIYNILPVYSQSFVQLYESLKACFFRVNKSAGKVVK